MLSRLASAFVALSLLSPIAAAAQAAKDEVGVLSVAQAWRDGWNRHDAAALGKLFTEDADFVSVLGPDGRGRGRAGFVEAHAGMFRSMFARSVHQIQAFDSRLLRPDIAVAHLTWMTTGDAIPGVPPGPRRGVFTWVLQKVEGRWLIAAAQNTEAPPRPPR